ncbi:M56 family metallopeptidase [Montanilutibacter psychrotolerans]|uniref:M56 family metallopeptidase n=1 Tax=Montanilutibacter psychrotolerans TaxID=1327343 RepID=A0A3M8SQL4_9GAMM|nr:M56 family metallopeptidase [Lysobacter psychrotolerans]RNF83073.1 M56 family metallopeptidase [Lysobacter psychrotolerans]
MMDGLWDWLLNYAIEHLLVSVVIAPVVYAVMRVKTVAPEKRATLLLVAIAFVIIGPALALSSTQHDVARHTLAQTGQWDVADANPPANKASAFPDSEQDQRQGTMAVSSELAALTVLLWLAGAAWGLGRLAVAHASVRRILAASRRSTALEETYHQVIPAGIHVHVSPTFGPAVVGIIRPKIVVPRALVDSLPADSLRAVLLHETLHIHRKDLPVLLLQRMAEAVLWWSPAVRLMGAALDSAREIACDIGASRVYGSSVDYAEALLVSVERLVSTRPRNNAQALCATASLTTLDQRIDAIIEERPASGRATTATHLSVGALLAVLCIAADSAAPRIAMRRPVVAIAGQPPQSEVDAITALHDGYTRLLYDLHDHHTRTLQHLSDAYTRDLTALGDIPDSGERDRRAARLNRDYQQASSTAESRFRTAAAQAETKFNSAQKALGYP